MVGCGSGDDKGNKGNKGKENPKVQENLSAEEIKKQNEINKRNEVFNLKKSEYLIDNFDYIKVLKKIKTSDREVRETIFTPDGRYMVSVINERIDIWELDNVKTIMSLRGHQNKIYSIACSPDGKILASGSEDNTLKIWDMNTGKELKTIKVENKFIRFVVFSPDGKYLACLDKEYRIVILDVDTGKEIKNIYGEYTSFDWSPDGEHLACVHRENGMVIWDVSTGNKVKEIKNDFSKGYIIKYSPNGNFLAIASGDNFVRILDINAEKIVKNIEGPKEWGQNKNLKYSPDGKWLVTVNKDYNLIIFNVETGRQLLYKDIGIRANYLSYDKYGKNLVLGDGDDEIMVVGPLKFDVNKGRTKKQINVIGNDGQVIGALPENISVEVSMKTGEIYKPLVGKINAEDVEVFYKNNERHILYTTGNTPVYADDRKQNILTNIQKGRVIKELYYSKELNLFYIEEMKGWIEPDNIAYLKNEDIKLAVFDNNTNTFDSIEGIRENTYSSGDIVEVEAYEQEKAYYYLSDGTWIKKEDVMFIDESKNKDRIFASKDKVKFNYDFTGSNYKNIAIGTEFKLLGIAGEFSLVENNSTKEKGWVSKENLSTVKPDLNNPTILITNTSIEESMLTIEGKVYDDTFIEKVLLNGNEIKLNPINKFDKIQYIPEVGYSFKSQWFLIEGMENNIELKVVDREGKSYAKTLTYTPQLEEVNLKEFKLENIIVKEAPKLEYSIELKDENNDGILTGSEKITLTVTIKNIGKGLAQNVNLSINNSSENHISYRNAYSFGAIKANESKIAVIDFTGKNDLIEGRANFDLVVEEQNGFNPFPANFSFNIEPKRVPKLEIIDYAIDDENKNGQIEQGEKFDIYVVVQNIGDGDIRNVIFNITKKIDGIINMSESTFKFEKLESGESKKIKSTFITNYKYKGDGSLPFELSLYEDFAKEKELKNINLVMNKAVPTIKEVNLEAKAKTKVVKKAEKISLISDIDTFIDKFEPVKEDNTKWAVVIGIEDYRKAVSVNYAKRDAQAVKKYFDKLMGVPDYNIFYLEDAQATLGEVKVLLQDKLQGRVKEGDTVYFYFSGHGIPTNEGDTYLLLHDSDH